MPKVSIPDDLKCPITKEIFVDPVIASDGHTYEKSAIEKWFNQEKKDTSPLTGQQVSNKTIIPNIFAKKSVNDFLEKSKICKREYFLELIEKEDMEKLSEVNYLESYLDIKIDDKTLLIYAAAKNKVKLAEWLLQEEVDIEEKYPNGSTALSFAAQAGATDVVNLLIRKGANIEAITNKIENEFKNFTPLFWAINGNKIDVVKLLLTHKAKLTAKLSKNGWTPLHYAASLGQKEIVEILMEHGADPKLLDNDGKTPAKVAMEHNQRETAALFTTDYKKILEEEAKAMPSRVLKLEKVVVRQEELIKKQQGEIESLKSAVEKLTKQISEIENSLKPKNSRDPSTEKNVTNNSFLTSRRNY